MLLVLRGIQRLEAKWGIFAAPIGEAGGFAAPVKSFRRFFFLSTPPID
jgi:hypothetical protein